MYNGGSPLPSRGRRGWAIAGGVVACWVLMMIATGSAAAATIILVSVALFGVVVVAGLRVLGIADRPLFRRIAGRRPSPRPAPVPERQYAYVAPEDAPTRAFLPGAQAAGAQHVGGGVDGGRADRGRADLISADRGRDAAPTRSEPKVGSTVMDGMATVLEQVRPAVPKLQLITGSMVSETTRSGAQAGRGPVDLQLPDVPTVSRVHATFHYVSGRWWVTSKGTNGLCVNGAPVAGKHPVSDGDEIRWGKREDAPKSTVRIG